MFFYNHVYKPRNTEINIKRVQEESQNKNQVRQGHVIAIFI